MLQTPDGLPGKVEEPRRGSEVLLLVQETPLRHTG